MANRFNTQETVPCRDVLSTLGDGRILQSVDVSWEFPIVFTRNVFAASNNILPEMLRGAREQVSAKSFIFIDEGVVDAWPRISEKAASKLGVIEGITVSADPITVSGGEKAKDGLGMIDVVGRACSDAGIDRHSYIVAIGGGAMLDAVGFAVSIVHRGIRLLRMPTTVLGQNDAGIGVKNGVNALGQKNFYGCFQPPFAVIDDLDFLNTLDDRHWRSGFSEALKVAAIKDAEFFLFLCENAAAINARDESAMEYLVRKCAELHVNHTGSSGDPFETGSSRPLDFGHWSAHWLEMATDGKLCHGEAVAVGLCLDILYAKKIGLVSSSVVDQMVGSLLRAGFAVYDRAFELLKADGTLAVFEGLNRFREHLGGELTLVLPDGIGASKEIHDVDLTLMAQCITELKNFQV